MSFPSHPPSFNCANIWWSVQNMELLLCLRSRDSSVVSALCYGLNDLGFEVRHGLRIFLFTTVSRQALEPTQPTIQWVPGALCLGIKRPGREVDHSPPPSPEVNQKCVELYLHSPNTSWRSARFKVQRQLYLLPLSYVYPALRHLPLEGDRQQKYWMVASTTRN
jgi:hypothetical protein